MKLVLAITALLAIGVYGRSVELMVEPKACDPALEPSVMPVKPVVSIMPVPTDKLPVVEVGVIEETEEEVPENEQVLPLFGSGDVSLVHKDQGISILPIGGGSMLPVEQPAVSIMPVDGGVHKLPVRPIREPQFLPVAEPIVSIMPVPSDKLPVEEVGVIEETEEVPEIEQVLPLFGAGDVSLVPHKDQGISILPIQGGGETISILPVDSSNKLPVEEVGVIEETVGGDVITIFPIQGGGEVISILPVKEPSLEVAPVIEPVLPGQPIVSILPVQEPSLEVVPVVEPVLPGQPIVSILPVEGGATNKLPVRPVREPVFQIMPVPAPVVSILPVAPEVEGCDDPSHINILPVQEQEQHEGNKWIIF